MSKSIYYNRTRLLNLFTEKEFSAHTRKEIAYFFKNISPEKKEDTAKLLYPIVKDCQTEQEAMKRVEEVIAKMEKA